MTSTDNRVVALSERAATVLSEIWYNVFRPGARRCLRGAELDGFPRSMLPRKPLIIKDVMYQLRLILSPPPGRMPSPQVLATFDPLAIHSALEKILDRTQSDKVNLEQEESELSAQLSHLNQLSRQIRTAASARQLSDPRGCGSWTYDEYLRSARNYDLYRQLKQQDPTASYLENFDKYEVHSAANPFRRPPMTTTALFSRPVCAEPYRPFPRVTVDAGFRDLKSRVLTDEPKKRVYHGPIVADLPNGVSRPSLILPTRDHAYSEQPGKESPSSLSIGRW